MTANCVRRPCASLHLNFNRVTDLEVQQRICYVLEQQNLFTVNNVFLIRHISFSHRYSTNLVLFGLVGHENTWTHPKKQFAGLKTHMTVCATWQIKCRVVRLFRCTRVDMPRAFGSLHASNAYFIICIARICPSLLCYSQHTHTFVTSYIFTHVCARYYHDCVWHLTFVTVSFTKSPTPRSVTSIFGHRVSTLWAYNVVLNQSRPNNLRFSLVTATLTRDLLCDSRKHT